MTGIRFLVVICVVAGCLGVTPPPAFSAACRVTVTTLSFGAYDIFWATAKSATAEVTVICNNKAASPASVQFILSPGSSGSFGQRTMAGSGGGAPLLYNIYSSAGLSAVMGDGTGGSASLSALVDKTAPWVITLFGSIPPRQTVLVGTYTDSLTATIIY